MADERGVVVACDCSTTAAKAVVVDARGATLGTGSSPLRTTSPRPGWHEQDAATWWSATSAAVAQAVAASGRGSDVVAVCAAHQRESFACLDADGRPLRPAVLWLDGRAGEEIARLGTEEVERLCGKPADITPALYKLAWLARHEPAVLRGAARVVDVHGYLVHAMTGRWVTSVSSADPLALLDVTTGDYAPQLLEVAGVRRDQLLELRPAGAVLGELRPEVARAWGVPGSAVVVAGLGDGQAAGVGAGVLDAGLAYLNLGTAVLLGTEQEGYRPSRDYRSLVSVVPGATTLEAFLSSGTYLPTWFRRAFGRAELDGAPDADLEAAAARTPPGAEELLTLPYWNAAQTPHWDAAASGAVVGWRGVHGPGHLYRSLMEGVALEVRAQLEGLERGTGRSPRALRGMGGGFRSPLWRQVVADVLERPVEMCTEPEVSALGAAVVAFTALGVHPDLPAAAAAMTSTGEVLHPDPGTAEAYRGLAEVHRQLYGALRPAMHSLAGAQARRTGSPAPEPAPDPAAPTDPGGPPA